MAPWSRHPPATQKVVLGHETLESEAFESDAVVGTATTDQVDPFQVSMSTFLLI